MVNELVCQLVKYDFAWIVKVTDAIFLFKKKVALMGFFSGLCTLRTPRSSLSPGIADGSTQWDDNLWQVQVGIPAQADTEDSWLKIIKIPWVGVLTGNKTHLFHSPIDFQCLFCKITYIPMYTHAVCVCVRGYIWECNYTCCAHIYN